MRPASVAIRTISTPPPLPSGRLCPKLSESVREGERSVLPVNFSFPTDRSQSHGRLTLTITARSAAGAATGQLDHNFDFPERGGGGRQSGGRVVMTAELSQPSRPASLVTGHCSLYGHWSLDSVVDQRCVVQDGGYWWSFAEARFQL